MRIEGKITQLEEQLQELKANEKQEKKETRVQEIIREMKDLYKGVLLFSLAIFLQNQHNLAAWEYLQYPGQTYRNLPFASCSLLNCLALTSVSSKATLLRISRCCVRVVRMYFYAPSVLFIIPW